MDFPRINEALEVCRAHLDATGARNTEVESYLVSYLLSIIYAEYEQAIKRLVAERAGRDADIGVRNFTEHASGKIVRSIKIGELKGFLGAFHEACKNAFATSVDNQPAASAYGNIIINRHAVAHKRGSNMTLRELTVAFADSRDVLNSFSRALDVDPPS